MPINYFLGGHILFISGSHTLAPQPTVIGTHSVICKDDEKPQHKKSLETNSLKLHLNVTFTQLIIKFTCNTQRLLLEMLFLESILINVKLIMK